MTINFQDAYKALEAAKAEAEKAAKLGVATGDAGVINFANENLSKATAAFCEVLERDTVQIEGKVNLLRAEYSLLQKLASDNKVSLEKIINGITVENGRIVEADWESSGLKDISAVAGLTALTWLNLNDNQITDISALKGLATLTELYLVENQITDISALSGLTALTELELQSNNITDISALQGRTALTRLLLSNNQITDISALKGLTALTVLHLKKNPLIKNKTLQELIELFRSRDCDVRVDL